MHVTLKAITRENLDDVLKLKLADYQQTYVSDNARSLALAWVYRDTAFPFAIYANEKVVGFVMLGYYEKKQQYTLWKFMIDEKEQHKGYGKIALQLAIQQLTERFHVTEIYTGVAFANTVARDLYRSFGFVETGDADATCYEMRLRIKPENAKQL